MKKIAVFLFAALGLSACSQFRDRLLFIEETHIGLKAKAGIDQTAPADIDFGYRRSILTLIPKANARSDETSSDNPGLVKSPSERAGSANSVDPCAKKNQGQPIDPNEPLSVISSFNADVRWFEATRVRTYFATGDAATNTACSSGAIKALVTPPRNKED